MVFCMAHTPPERPKVEYIGQQPGSYASRVVNKPPNRERPQQVKTSGWFPMPAV